MKPVIGRASVSASILADYLGEHAAAVVIEHYGGASIKTPRRPQGRVFDDLCTRLGPDLAALFVETFQGEHLYVALSEHDAAAARLADLLALQAQGLTFAQIAQVYRAPGKRYTERWVRELLRRHDEQQAPGCSGKLTSPPP